MKKLYFTAALLFCAFAASAQVVEVDVIEREKRRGWAGYETNRFWDNWEISAAGGAQIMVFDGAFGKNDPGTRFKHMNWQASFSLTKWVHPVTGLRLQLQGGEYQNTLIGGNRYMKNPYLFAHFDVMVNLSNWIGGARDDRAYYAVPFAGFGYHASGFTDKFQNKWNLDTEQSFAFTAGLLNKFRVCPALDIDLELKMWMLPTANTPQVLSANTGRIAIAYSGTVGLTYRFNRRGFQKASDFTMEDVLLYQAAVAERDLALAAAARENAAMANDLAAAEAAAKRAAAEAAQARKEAEQARWGSNGIPADQLNGEAYTEDIYLTSKGISFFVIGRSELSDKEKLRLDIIAAQIKDAPKGRVYLIEGHADKQTGTAAINKRLAEQRAKMVYDYLISQGVKAENLSYQGYGDTKPPFDRAPENRVTIIR